MSILRPGDSPSIAIRLAKPKDADSIAALATQLGYPSTREEVERRLKSIRRDADHLTVVATRGERVVAWLHAFICRLLESNPFVEIGGLVVEETCRGRGLGRLLMERAEDWARRKRCRAVYLRSNVIRKDAHAFYSRLGYEQIKTQHAFRKIL